MLKAVLARLVDFCARRAKLVVTLYAVVGAVAAVDAVRSFSISTDIAHLLPAALPWRQHQIRYQRLFPAERLLAIVDAPTPEAADRAADAFADALDRRSRADGPIRRATLLGSGPFFVRNALMLAPLDRVRALSRTLVSARPLLARLVADPTLRGYADVLGDVADAAATGQAPPGSLHDLFADTARAIDGDAPFSPMRAFGIDASPDKVPGERLITVSPGLDYRALQPGRAATEAVRAAWAGLAPRDRDGATIALTGEVPVNDEQFATIRHGQAIGTIGTALAVTLIFFLALRSARIVAAVALSLAVGFALTVAAGLLAVGSFNLISIAFAILFIGLGADFGIQFCVRYRDERYRIGRVGDADALRRALGSAAERAGIPLALAAASTAVGFFSFLPTDYRGVSELGLIAGIGMLIAFSTTVTLLPALLAVFRPPAETRRMGFGALKPLDRFLGRHRLLVVGGTLGTVLAASPLLVDLRFDFDPTHMQLPSAPAVATFHRLQHERGSGVEAIDLAAPDLRAADALASRLAKIPEVGATRTASVLVPTDPGDRLALLAQLRASIGSSLAPAHAPPPPDDRLTVGVLRDTARALDRAARGPSPPAGAGALARAFRRLADAGPPARRNAEARLLPPLVADLDRLRASLAPVAADTVATLPPDLRRQWIAADGQARVEVLPRGDTASNATLARFARAVLRVAPGATGNPVVLIGSRRTVIAAFAEAGAFAVLAIAVVLAVALRRLRDVLLTLLPLLVAGLVTLELAVVLGIALNFANIIALPLLLGVGVAFKIYYVVAWREGVTDLLQSTLTRAVLFSAATTATAFGSLWLSPAPGLASMGKLMVLALACTLAAAVLFQPALMGPPRRPKDGSDGSRPH